MPKRIARVQRSETRIQKRNRQRILDAGLDIFSQYGLRGSTLDQIAAGAGLSKPNIIYYFNSKEAIYRALLDEILQDWLAPLQAIDPLGHPVEELVSYARRKLALSRTRPRESRLFAIEILQGAPVVADVLSGDLAPIMEGMARTLDAWVRKGRMRPVDPYHMIFSIWATTQHYADFEVQVRAVLPKGSDPFEGAERQITQMLRALLTP